MKYNINYYSKFEYDFSYDNIHIELNILCKKIVIYNNNKNMIYVFFLYTDNTYCIYCYENEKNIIYIINNNCIEIYTEKLYNKNISFHKKNLKIFEIKEYYNLKIIYNEKRNNNNEITYLKKNNDEKFISNNINPPFSKPLKKYCIELINDYNNNISIFTKIIKSVFKKTNKAHYNLLLNDKF